MRYIDKEGNTLNFNECMTANSFLMEADGMSANHWKWISTKKES